MKLLSHFQAFLWLHVDWRCIRLQIKLLYVSKSTGLRKFSVRMSYLILLNIPCIHSTYTHIEPFREELSSASVRFTELSPNKAVLHQQLPLTVLSALDF